MYKRLFIFLSDNNIYNLQFEFRQQYSASHALPLFRKERRVAEGCGWGAKNIR